MLVASKITLIGKLVGEKYLFRIKEVRILVRLAIYHRLLI